MLVLPIESKIKLKEIFFVGQVESDIDTAARIGLWIIYSIPNPEVLGV